MRDLRVFAKYGRRRRRREPYWREASRPKRRHRSLGRAPRPCGWLGRAVGHLEQRGFAAAEPGNAARCGRARLRKQQCELAGRHGAITVHAGRRSTGVTAKRPGGRAVWGEARGERGAARRGCERVQQRTHLYRAGPAGPSGLVGMASPNVADPDVNMVGTGVGRRREAAFQTRVLAA